MFIFAFNATIWNKIKKQEEGTVLTDEGIFVFAQFSTTILDQSLDERSIIVEKKGFLIPVSFVSQEKLEGQYGRFRNVVIIIDLIVLGGFILGFYFYLRLNKQQKIQQQISRESEEKFRNIFKS